MIFINTLDITKFEKLKKTHNIFHLATYVAILYSIHIYYNEIYLHAYTPASTVYTKTKL